MIEYLARRPFSIIFALIGVILATIFVARVEDTRKDQIKLRERVVQIETDSPCTELTTRECAAKLFGALDPEERSRLVRPDIRREVQREIERIQDERIRQRVRRQAPRAEGVERAPIQPSPIRPPASPSAPVVPTTPHGRPDRPQSDVPRPRPSLPTPSTPEAPSAPHTVDPPPIDPPPVDVPPVDLPPIVQLPDIPNLTGGLLPPCNSETNLEVLCRPS